MKRLVPIAAIFAFIASPGWAEPQRIVTVGSAVSETVAALGAESELVAVDSTSVYPPMIEKLPKIGYLRALSAEGVLSLRPTLVLLSADAGPRAAVAQLKSASIQVVAMPDGHSPATVTETVRRVATALGRVEAGESLAKRIEGEFAALSAALAKRKSSPKVLFILATSSGGLMASGTNTAASSIVELAGGGQAVTGYEGYKPISTEAAIAAEPDFILLPSHGVQTMGGGDAAKKIPQIALTKAGRLGHVVVMDSTFLLGFGPRTAQAAADLARRLHPGLALPDFAK